LGSVSDQKPKDFLYDAMVYGKEKATIPRNTLRAKHLLSDTIFIDLMKNVKVAFAPKV